MRSLFPAGYAAESEPQARTLLAGPGVSFRIPLIGTIAQCGGCHVLSL
jgi:hypothetical protein